MWEDLDTVKKGNLGEQIVEKEMERYGFIVYRPVTVGAHGFDRLCVKDKEIAIIAEVKTKSMRKFYPDTGIDFRHYKDYKRMFEKYNLDTVLFFVDEEAQKVYYQKLSVLDRPESFKHNNKEITYPLIQKGIIYFHISKMVDLCKIDDETRVKLNKYTTKKEKYKNTVSP